MNYSNEQRGSHFPLGNKGSDTSTYGRTWDSGSNNSNNSSNSNSNNSYQADSSNN